MSRYHALQPPRFGANQALVVFQRRIGSKKMGLVPDVDEHKESSFGWDNRKTDTAAKAAILVGAVAVFAFTYLFFEVVILTFGAILIALLVRMIETPLEKRVGLSGPVATGGAIIILAVIAGGAAYLFGTRLTLDFQDVLSRMGEAQERIRSSLQSSAFGKIALSHLSGAQIPITGIVANIFTVSTRVMAGALVAVVAGIYLAAQPSVYFNGLMMLFPKEKRAYAAETVSAAANGLYRWLEGQLVTMLLVGALSTLAWWAIGLPSPLGLGLIAGITEFIPYAGPVIGAIPALLVAATLDPMAVLWTFIAYIGIHALEGNVIAPLIQRQLVYIPPALMLLGIASISIIYGMAAILFAAPIVVVLFVLVEKLYVRDSLGEPAQLPGEQPPA
jgi:predicted PurR-regulated permease PerM